MDESSNNLYYDQNQDLFNKMLTASSSDRKRDILDKLLLANTGLLKTVAKNSGWAQYATCEYEDVLQTTKMYYIQIIMDKVNAGETNYPETVYPEVLRLVQESLSRPYSNSGVAIPYSTKKVMQRRDYEKTKSIGASTSYTNDGMEASAYHSLEAKMTQALTGMDMEDRICIMMVIQDILKKQTLEIQQMFEDRFYNKRLKNRSVEK